MGRFEDASQPTLLLIHGAFFGGWSWDSVRRKLLAQGWRTQTVELPSTAEVGGPRRGLYDDAEVVRRRITEIDGPVVVVAHSYGGAVATQAAAGLSNVRHLVYISAFQLDVGESLLGIMGKEPDWWRIDGDIMTTHDPQTVFFNDIPSDAADRAAARLLPFSVSGATETVTAAAWHTIPSTYIVTDQDNAGPAEAQQFLSSRATYVYHLPSGHLSLLSMPSAVAGIIAESAERDARVTLEAK